MPDVDALVIGSGPGGLAAGLCLARQGLLTLVLEQHYLPGGYSHSFPLGGHLWSPGVHYVGELGPQGQARRFFEGLGLGGELAFCQLDPEGYDVVLLPEQRLAFASGFEATAERFAAAFPGERAGIEGWFGALRAISQGRAGAMGSWPLQRLVDQHLRDPRLRGLVLAQHGNYGLPPSRAPARLHADVCAHYEEGGGYPLGGGRSISRAFIRALREEGGEIQVDTRVAEILTEPSATGRRAVGVRLASGEEITAGAVVSNADPEVTFRRLIGGGLLSAERRRQLDRCPWSVSCLSLFATAHLDPAELGLGAANYWILHDPDPERAYALGELERLERLPYVMVSVPSLKDPSSRRSGLYPIEAFALVPHAPFADWSATTHGHRPEGYLRLKEHLRRLMLRAASRLIPGLEERVDFCELGTPLTNAHFCAATRGAIYGVERAVDQPPGLDATCEFEGLYLAGSSTSSHGVFGAARSGVEAAAAVLGLQVESLLQSEGPPLELLDPRAPEDWPARWQQKLRPSDASA